MQRDDTVEPILSLSAQAVVDNGAVKRACLTCLQRILAAACLCGADAQLSSLFQGAFDVLRSLSS